MSQDIFFVSSTKGSIMKLSTLAKSIGCTATLAIASFSAHAIDSNIDVGVIVAPATFSQVWQKSVGAFTDTWSFTITAPTFAAGSVSNLAISIPNLTLFNITGLSAQLYTSTNVLIDDLDDNAGSTSEIKVGSGLFSTGDYYFKLSGTADGTFGGQYVFAVTTLPVPEPESYAMLLAGLGVMGAIAMRRNKRKTD